MLPALFLKCETDSRFLALRADQVSPEGEVLFFKEKYPKELPTPSPLRVHCATRLITDAAELARFMAGSNSPRLTRN